MNYISDNENINEKLEWSLKIFRESGTSEDILTYLREHQMFNIVDPAFAMLEHRYWSKEYSLDNIILNEDIIETYEPIAELCAIFDGNAFLSQTIERNGQNMKWSYQYIPVAMSILKSTPDLKINKAFMEDKMPGNLSSHSEMSDEQKDKLSRLLPFTSFLGMTDEDGLNFLHHVILSHGGYNANQDASFMT